MYSSLLSLQAPCISMYRGGYIYIYMYIYVYTYMCICAYAYPIHVHVYQSICLSVVTHYGASGTEGPQTFPGRSYDVTAAKEDIWKKILYRIF